MFYKVKLSAGDETHNFGVDAVSYTDAEKMAYEIGNMIAKSAAFSIAKIDKVAIADFIEDDSLTKDIYVYKGKYITKETTPKNTVRTKTFNVYVEGESVADALVNLQLFLKGFVIDTEITGMERTELTEIYTADSIRELKASVAMVA